MSEMVDKVAEQARTLAIATYGHEDGMRFWNSNCTFLGGFAPWHVQQLEDLTLMTLLKEWLQAQLEAKNEVSDE